MIIRKELDYDNTFIRGDIIDFEKGYSKHGTFLKINNKIIDCGYIEENTLKTIAVSYFFTMGKNDLRMRELEYLLSCNIRLYYLMNSYQKRELEEAKKKRVEGELEEALQLHINYCYNNLGRIEGEVYEELSRLMVAMSYYDLGLCFLSLANLSEVQVYSDDVVLKNNKNNFDKLKKVVEYQYSEEVDVEKRDKLRKIIKEFAGEYAKYHTRFGICIKFELKQFLIEDIDSNKDVINIEYIHKGKKLHITQQLISDLEKQKLKVYIDEHDVIYKEGELYECFIEKILELKNIYKQKRAK